MKNTKHLPFGKEKQNQYRLTIVIIRDVGKVISFKISPFIALLAMIIFLIYIPTSIFVINRYLDLRYIATTQDRRIEYLEKDLHNINSLLNKSKQQVASLEIVIKDLEEQRKQTSKHGNEKDFQPNKDLLVNDQPMGGSEEVYSKHVVDFEDMRIKREEERLKIDFKLVNNQPQENPDSGYVQIIAVDRNSEPPQEWAYPNTKLSSGFSLNFRHGLYFRIRRFKPINVSFDPGPDTHRFSVVKVRAYNLNGVLIREKEFIINDLS